jgi:hypothetical protein
LDLQDLQGLLDLLVLKDHKDRRVQLVCKDPLVRLDLLVQQVLRVYLVQRVYLVLRVLMETLDRQVRLDV